MTNAKSIPSVSVSYAQTGRTIRSNELGMRPMQERAWEKRGEQYLLIKSRAGEALDQLARRARELVARFEPVADGSIGRVHLAAGALLGVVGLLLEFDELAVIVRIRRT